MHLFFLSHTEFGINTNILETNVLNLAVVLGFIIVYGGNVFRDVMETRRDRIVKTMMRAEEKLKEAQAALKDAQLKLVAAKYKAVVIRSQGRIVIQRLNIRLLEEAREEQTRFRKTEYEKRILLEKKSLRSIQGRVMAAIVAKVPSKVIKRFEDTNVRKLTTLYWITTMNPTLGS